MTTAETYVTHISLVDGERGELRVRGRSLEDLVRLSSGELAQLLLGERLIELGTARQQLAPQIRALLPWARPLQPVEWLRLAVDAVDAHTPARLVATLGLALALRRQPQAEADPEADHAEDILRMALGHPPEHWQVAALQAYWACVAEHGFNASTFTARVVASTGAGARAAVSAALGALQGPLHGGAPGPVLDMLDELERCSEPAHWIRQKLARGERLMGFGHRIYRRRDPRVEVLRKACQATGRLAERLEFATRMEALASAELSAFKPGRPLPTNVEYYTALLLDAIGFERQEFAAVFAAGRVLGWLAHIEEQRRSGKLIRPEARYLEAFD